MQRLIQIDQKSKLDFGVVIKQLTTSMSLIVMQKYSKYTKPLCMIFINYEKALDSTDTSAIMKTLRKYGVEETYMKILEDIYRESTATIKLHKVSEKMLIKKGVRQGDTTSPKLYTAVIEEVFQNLEWEKARIKINREYLNNLRFADDVDERING